MKRIWSYYAAVFLGAFLLFQVQPMTSKALLPRFGGSYLVWGACMVFYQGVLLLGYVYAHVMQRRFGVARYARLHWLMLAAPVLFFPFNFELLGASASGLPLAVEVARLLLLTVSLPFLVLSTTSLILQRWLSISDLPERVNPYVLYGASNLGSMLALLTYPVVVEPLLSLKNQGYAWWAGYAILAIMHYFCNPRSGQNLPASETASSTAPPSSQSAIISWFLLSVASCSMLLAVTNVITFDIASVPFLWVMPLSVYLLSFVVTFKRRPWYPRWALGLMYWMVILGVLLHTMAQLRLSVPASVSIALHLSILFVVCLNCNGRLMLSRPDNPDHLTTFYLVLAVGGLAGSIIVSWILPLVSKSLVEYPLAFVIVVVALAASEGKTTRNDTRAWAELAVVVLFAVLSLTILPLCAGRFLGTDGGHSRIVLVLVAVPVVLILRYVVDRPWHLAAVLLVMTVATNWTEELAVGATGVKRHRNFYGIYKVYDIGKLRYLQHGTTQHGRQYIAGPKTSIPLAYFHPTTPAAGVLSSTNFVFDRIGMVGLGTGALACYARAGQSFTIYELDPDNLGVARNNFTYLDIAEHKGVDLDFVFGDGRVSIRGVGVNTLDLLIIDAFNSGSIPVHLLTVEAFTEYFKALRPGGILLLHVSNKILDLMPVVYSNARAMGVAACEMSNKGRCHPDAENTDWMALSRSRPMVQQLIERQGWWNGTTARGVLPRPWTDQYSNVLGAMF